MGYTIIDRETNVVAEADELMDIAGEETQLWRDEDGDGQFAEYNSPMMGDERDYIWQREDGTEITIGKLVYE